MIFRKIHATTTSISTYLRMGVIMAFAAVTVALAPYYGDKAFDFFSFNAINIGLLFAVLSGFLMMITLTRKQSLMTYISLELNKIRRLHHLAFNIQLATPSAQTWYKKIDQEITNYFDLFRFKDFRFYEEGNTLFRRITYTIYQLPVMSKTYNTELYAALLQTSGESTEAREQIRSLKDSSIGIFQWASMTVVTLSFAIIIALATPESNEARIVSAIVIFNLLLMMQLLYEYDRINPRKGRAIAQIYLRNEELMRITPEDTDGFIKFADYKNTKKPVRSSMQKRTSKKPSH